MKLISYELLKLSKKKVLLMVLALLFALNWFLFYNQQSSQFFRNTPEYTALENEYADMNPDEALEKLDMLESRMGQVAYLISGKSAGKDETLLKNEMETMFSESPHYFPYEKLLEQYGQYMEANQPLNDILIAISSLRAQFTSIVTYPGFIDSMQEKADQMQSVSVFNQEGSFAYRNIIKTVQDFSDLKGVSLSVGDETGVVAVSAYPLTDYFLIAIVIFLCIYLFSHERENGLLVLVKATKCGRYATAGAKIAALTGITVVTAIAFYLVNFIVAEGMFGFGNTNRLIQSMPAFRDADIPLTVMQYFIGLLASKLCSLVLIAILTGLCFVLFSKVKQAYIVIGAFLTTSFLCYTLIPPTSYINILKYLNPFAFLDGYRLWAGYNNLNLFGFPISRITASLIVMTVGFVIGLLVYLAVFSRASSRTFAWRLPLPRFLKNPRSNRGSASLFIQELYKNMIGNKILLFLLVALIIGLGNLNTEEMQYMFDDQVYQSYANQLAGEVNDEKTALIEAEQQRFDTIALEYEGLAERLRKSEITYDEYLVESSNLDRFSRSNAGFQLAKQQYNYLLSLKDRGITGSFISVISSDYLFDSFQRDVLLGLIYSVMLILCLGNVFCCEYNKGMIHMIRSTRNGRNKLLFTKTGLSYLTAFLLTILLYLPVYITFLARYDISDWSAPIQSIQLFEKLPFPINIAGLVSIAILIQLLTAFVMTNVILLLSQLVKKQNLTMILSVLILTVPFIFGFFAVSVLQFFTASGGFTFYNALARQDSFLPVLFYAAGLLTAGFISGVYARRRFCG